MNLRSYFQKWYDIYKDDQGLKIALGLDPYSDTVPENLAQNWFFERESLISKYLKKAFKGDKLKVYRCLNVPSDWVRKLESGEISDVGSHWTIDQELVPYLKGGFGGKMSEENVVLEALVSAKDIDLLDLFQPSYADDYEEFEVIVTTEVELYRVWSGSLKKVLAQFSPDLIIKTLS